MTTIESTTGYTPQAYNALLLVFAISAAALPAWAFACWLWPKTPWFINGLLVALQAMAIIGGSFEKRH